MMDHREHILEFSIANFTKFGSKYTTMDDLAHKMGISKKTIYQYFKNKEELVSESLQFMLKKIKNDIQTNLIKEKNQPLKSIVYIYQQAFGYLENFSPSFLFGLQKYYPLALKAYENFREEIVYVVIMELLRRAQELKQLRSGINLKLFCDINLLTMDNLLYSKSNLFEKHSVQELLEYAVINNIKGIMTPKYLLENKM